MATEGVRRAQFASAERIAQRFVAARLSAVPLIDFPGEFPPDLASAYECQEAAIALWPDRIAGWKIGRVPQESEKRHGAQRLSGPLFRHDVHRAHQGSPVEFGIFSGGFAAVEAEYVYEIGCDAPAGKLSWSLDEVAAIVKSMHIGVELAGSPLPTINALGPAAVIADFGNNAGLIVGPEITGWRDRSVAELTCEAIIDGRCVGRGGAENILGGPLASLQFVAEHCAQRGRPLIEGMLVTTGAATGIHEIASGQSVHVVFHRIGTIQAVPKVRSARRFVGERRSAERAAR